MCIRDSRCTEQDWYLAFAFAETAQTPYREVLPKELRLSFAGGTENPYAYSLRLKDVYKRQSMITSFTLSLRRERRSLCQQMAQVNFLTSIFSVTRP